MTWYSSKPSALDAIAWAKQNRPTGLSLEGLSLRALPTELLELTWLRDLNLSNNLLSKLPDEISRFRNLDALYVQNNRLTQLPSTFTELASLRFATFDGNHLTSLPSGLERLTQLSTIRVEKNRISNLPADLTESVYRCISGLESNPLDDSLRAMVRAGDEAVVAYLRSLASGVEQYEAKLVLVGEGDVGKSSLIAALLNAPFVENRATTHGIEISRLRLPHPDVVGTSILLNCWDFGGQEVYRITHQFFFSRRSLYLVVWNARQGHESNEVEGWLTRLRLRLGDDAHIIVVATHSDERRAEIDYDSLLRRFGSILVGHISVDSKSGTGIEDLTRRVAEQAAKLPQMGTLLSEEWIRAREILGAIESPYISYSDFEKVCAEAHLRLGETPALAALLHDLGVIIHYADDEGLRELIVLQPEWLTKAIGYVLEDEITRTDGGVLTHSRLAEIWGQRSAGNYPKALHPFFLRLMEKFDVSYRLPDHDASLVGQLVPYQRPPLREGDEGRDRILALKCVMEDEAPGLMAWITVRNHRFSVNRHWRRGVELEYAQYGSWALIELTSPRTLELAVKAPSPDFFFNILRDGIEELLTRRWPGLQFDFYLPCRRNGCSGYFALKLVLKYRENDRATVDCPECLEAQNVAELLTGFAPAQQAELEVLQEIRLGQRALGDQLMRVEAYAAQAAHQTRALLRAAGTEVQDCPRLFTVTDKSHRLAVGRGKHAIHLWCEAQGAQHAADAEPYLVANWSEWVMRIAPYARRVAKCLALLVPVATTGISDLLSSDDAALVNRHLELLKVASAQVGSLVGNDEFDDGLRLSAPDAVAVRGFRELLFGIDAAKRFGGLRRVTTPEGDLLWLCQSHALEYDPGLPSI